MKTKNELMRYDLVVVYVNKKYFEIVISDLKYIRVGKYISIILDIHNREIVGYSCGQTKRQTDSKRV